MSSCFWRMIVSESCLNKGETAVAQCSYTAVMASNMIISPCETLSIRSGWGSKANPWIAGVLYRGMITGTHWTSIFDRHDSRGVHWRWGHARLSTHLAGTWKGAIWNYLRRFLSTSSSKWLISFREISPNCFKKSRPPMELCEDNNLWSNWDHLCRCWLRRLMGNRPSIIQRWERFCLWIWEVSRSS